MQFKSRLIINADDFGLTAGINRAIIKLSERGVVSSTSVMTNMPFYQEILGIKDSVGVGVHLNLTVGSPIQLKKNVPTLATTSGTFFSLKELLARIRQDAILKENVELEFCAQIERLLRLGVRPDHVNTHQSLLKYPFFFAIVQSVAKKYGIPAVRSYRKRALKLAELANPQKILKTAYLNFQHWWLRQRGFRVADRFDSLLRSQLNRRAAIQHLRELFADPWQGVLELIVHPGYCDGETAWLGSYGYEREAELQALMGETFKRVLEESQVELITFGHLEKREPRRGVNTLVKKVTPGPLRGWMRRLHRDYVFRRAMSKYHSLTNGDVSSQLIAELIYGWGNEGWTVHPDFARTCLQRAYLSQGPILECGSGLSTVLLGVIAKRMGKRVFSFEHNSFWARRVQSVLKQYDIQNVDLCVTTLRNYGDYFWYDPPWGKMPDEFDLVICDGPPCNTPGGRYGMMPVMKSHLAPGCVILMDDAAGNEERNIVIRWAEEMSAHYQISDSEKPFATVVLQQTNAVADRWF